MTRVVRVPYIVPTWAAAQTWGHTILWKASIPLNEHVLAHELRHVTQWDQHGLVFPLLYVWQWISVGFRYSRIPFELDAEAHASDPSYLKRARNLIAQTSRPQ